MKKAFLFVATLIIPVAIAITACGSDKEGVSTNDINIGGGGEKPVIEFDEETHDFGKITQGEKVSFSFRFKNSGKGNLLISSAAASCGCTVPKPPKDPIAPGASDKIDVTFDSNGKSGKFDKQITVITNCDPNTKILKITGEIIVPVSNEPNATKEVTK
ncbi:MAG: hypothetical protein K0S33_3572 [Bacteroidetes bacterium]|jgi:hypothetical protein|nr:hypothetical protein [Bacteroidota bacterium]